MQIAVMRAAERDGELIAHLQPERSGLSKAQVMRVCGLPATDKAGLLGDELQVLLVAQALGLAEQQGRLVDPAAGACGGRSEGGSATCSGPVPYLVRPAQP